MMGFGERKHRREHVDKKALVVLATKIVFLACLIGF
jgi:hypothetical protein